MYSLVRELPGVVIIYDTGKSVSVTDDARAVIARLTADGRISPGVRLLYYDANDVQTDELLHDGRGKFLGIRERCGGRRKSK